MFESTVQDIRSDRLIRFRSLTRSVVHSAALPTDVAEMLRDKRIERLIFSAVPLQVKDRCIAARYDHPAGALLVKRCNWGDLSRTIRSAWRTASARGCWKTGRKLIERSIPTPRPLACVEEKFGAIGYRSYLITEYIDGQSLYDCVHGGGAATSDLEHAARQVAEIWTRLVALRASHNDMKPENFIVDPSGRVWLIDLERVRFHRVGSRMRRRQQADVQTFLHPRAWRNQSDVRSIFRQAFLNSPCAELLQGMRSVDELAVDADASQSSADASRLTALILCQDSVADRSRIVRSIRSILHLVDEIIIVSSSAEELFGFESEATDSGAIAGSIGVRFARAHAPAPRLATHPWVLVLEAGEIVSPLLAIDIEEQISLGSACDAFRIPIEQHAFGQCVERSRRRRECPVRLLNQLKCSYSVAGGALAISVDPEHRGELGGVIERDVCASVAEFLSSVNDESSCAAAVRFQQGKPASLRSGLAQAIHRFVNRYFRQSRYQFGWAGLQLSLLESLSPWLQELKLWHLEHEFHEVEHSALDSDSDAPPSLRRAAPLDLSAVDTPRAKAA